MPKKPKPDWVDELLAEFDRRMDAIGVFEVDSYPETPSVSTISFGESIEPAPASDAGG